MPETGYVKSGDVNIAFQVVGDGPIDFMYAAGWVTNLDMMWDDPGLARFLNRLASFSRLITFDKRGIGLSDPVPPHELTDPDIRMDDMRAVLDEVGSSETVLFGHSEGGSTAIRFAHRYPERSQKLILACTYAKRLRSEDYPWAPTLEERIADSESIDKNWGSTQSIVDYYAPSNSGDTAHVSWLARYLRAAASPSAAAALNMGSSYIDVTGLLPEIQVPTLCLYRRDDPDVKIEEGRYIASKIPGAKFIEFPGNDHWIWAGDWEPLVEEIEEFVTGRRGSVEPDRRVATIVFTDIVGSTEMAASMGDTAWRHLLERHDAVSESELKRWGGRAIKTTGDGILALFDGPRAAVRFSGDLARSLAELGIHIRCGIHAGEVEMVGDDVAGMAVHIASRLLAKADDSETLVSRTVRDLLVGTDVVFESRGTHTLKGVPGEWELLAVV
ncbi:MAG: adenylate/guanylate cyclase domain-containing protein [Acidimicrobiia bacterium]